MAINGEIYTQFGSSYVTNTAGEALDLINAKVLASQLVWTEDTPSAVTFTGGTINVDTLTFDTVANTTHGDYVVVSDTAGNDWAVAASKAGIAEVTDMTCVGDVVAVAEVTDITAVADGAVKNQTQIVAVADESASLAGTSFKIYDSNQSVGVWISVDSVPGTAPDGALACDRQLEVGISEDDLIGTVGTAIYDVLHADADFAGVSDDTAGTIVVSDANYGVRTAASDAAGVEATGFTITTPTPGVDSTLDGTYFLLADEDGLVGCWIDTDNDGTTIPDAVNPVGGNSEGVNRALEITSISAGDSAATVAAALETDIHADSKFTASSATTVCTATNVTAQALSGQGEGTSGFTISEDTAGVTADLLDGTYFVLQDINGSVGFWIDTDDGGGSDPSGADRDVEITTVTSGMTASQVAGVVATAIDSEAGGKFSASAVGPVVTITNADLKALTDAADGDTGFTFEVTTQGADLGAEPTGAIWAAIPSANKTQADISGDTTAADVAARFETAFDGLTGFSAVITSDDTAANGTMTMTSAAEGVVADAQVKDDDDAGAGSISEANTVPGIASVIALVANTITDADHGLFTGVVGQCTTDGTLPAGLATSTSYYVIYVDDNTYKLASSLANANAGTAVDITDRGSDAGTHTFTPTAVSSSVKLQASNDKATWFDIANTTNAISADSSVMEEIADIGYAYIRIYLTVASGYVGLTAKTCVKAEE